MKVWRRSIADSSQCSRPRITHPTASFYKSIQDDSAEYLMGTLPSFTHTGLLAPWLPPYLQKAGGLVTLLLCNHSEHNDIPYYREHYREYHKSVSPGERAKNGDDIVADEAEDPDHENTGSKHKRSCDIQT